MGGEGAGAWHTDVFPRPPCRFPPHLVRVSLLAMLTHQKQSYFCNTDIITSHKSGCQGKTFLWAVVAQMFHKVVPAESKVRAQPAHPHLVPRAPLRG